MTQPIDPSFVSRTQPSVGLPGAQQVGKSAGDEGADFKRILMNSLDEVNSLQQEASQGVQRLIEGETDNVAEVFAAVRKAGIAFDMLMEIRNKLTDAYREIQNMRV